MIWQDLMQSMLAVTDAVSAISSDKDHRKARHGQSQVSARRTYPPWLKPLLAMQAKLQALEEQQQDGETRPGGAGVTAIAWRGTTSVVSAERVRVALGQALELSKQVRLPAAAKCMTRGDFRKDNVAPKRMYLPTLKNSEGF